MEESKTAEMTTVVTFNVYEDGYHLSTHLTITSTDEEDIVILDGFVDSARFNVSELITALKKCNLKCK